MKKLNKKITFSVSLNDYIIYKNLPFNHRKRCLDKFRLYGKDIISMEKRYYDYEKSSCKN